MAVCRLSLLALLVLACGGSDPSVPSAIALAPTAVTLTAIGQTAQLSASITDQRGDPVEQAEITWSSSTPTVATVSLTGLVTATGQGTTQVTAAVGGIAAIATVSVVQTVATFEKVGGDGQSGEPGAPLPQPFQVLAKDPLGNPIAGLTVVFAVIEGGGTVQPGSATTGLDGRATSVLTTGPTAGAPQEVTASADGQIVTFTALTTSPFDIEVRFLTSPSQGQAQAFADAAARWEALITSDLPDLQASAPAGACGSNSPAINEMVDDLIIFVTLEPIDGPGSVLGAAGPCFIRVPGDLSVIGRMRFDTDDLEQIEDAGVLGDVILHEMGHVLGIGTLWPQFGLLADPALGSPAGDDPHFTGTGAIAAFDAAGGATYADGEKVPVETEGGIGTADSHWRETVLGNELMTGFISQFNNPLSAISIRSLEDMGYDVTLTGADPFTFDPGLRAEPSGRRWHLVNDVMPGPIYGMDRSGRSVGVVRR